MANIETKIADAYQERKDNGIDQDDAITAIATIAAVFYTPSTGQLADSNPNALAYQQRSTLSSLVNNAVWTRDRLNEFIGRLVTEIKELESDVSEVGITRMERKLDMLERAKIEQLPIVEEWVKLTKAGYKAITGEDWKPFTKADNATDKSKVLEARKKMLLG